MKYLAFGLAFAGLITGLWAAFIWAKAARVEVAAPYGPGQIPPGPDVENIGWTIGLLQAVVDGSQLNFRAARWTAISVALNGLAAVTGTWPFN